MEFSENQKHIVVLGGGFGGLAAALHLGRAVKKLGLGGKYAVVLVDRSPHHIFTPLLYEVATTHEENATAHELEPLVTYPLKRLLAHSGVDFLLDEVLHMDLAEGVVHLKNGKLKYEHCIIALGGETNYYRIPGLEAHGLPLKTFRDALAIRERLAPRVGPARGLTRVVIGGAGATGVELAGEIREWSCEKKHRSTCNVHVTLIDGGAEILGGLDPRVRAAAERRLKTLGVQILTEERVARVDVRDIHLASGEKVPYDVFVWTGGVKAATFTEHVPMKREGRGRIEVRGELECLPEGPDLKIAGNVYAIGDIACLYDPETGAPSPWMARPAIEEGKIAAKNIVERMKFAEGMSRAVRTFTYRVPNYPYIVPVGGKYAVAKIGPFVLSGFPAWVFKGVVELNYFCSIMPWYHAVTLWLRGFVLFLKNDRLG